MPATHKFEYCKPVLAKSVPTGADWIHEVKYDGYRGRIVRDGRDVKPEVDQAAVDEAALAIAPHVVPATRTRYVYAPVSAILHQALGDACPVIGHTHGGKG